MRKEVFILPGRLLSEHRMKKLTFGIPDPASKLFCSALHFGITYRDFVAICSVCFGSMCISPLLSKSSGGVFVARLRSQVKLL